jgi:hypothetical protein
VSFTCSLNEYFAKGISAVFPDRVGRVVLDGVVDPEIWANRPAHEVCIHVLPCTRVSTNSGSKLWNRTINAVDAAMTGFVTACAAAGPDGCVLASKNDTPNSVQTTVLQIIDVRFIIRWQSEGLDSMLAS